MKIKLRSKGDVLLVCDENGNALEGVASVQMKPWNPVEGGAPQFTVTVVGKVEAQLDGEGQVEVVEPAQVSNSDDPAA